MDQTAPDSAPASTEPAIEVETAEYTDGSTATGVAPLPDTSPDGAPRKRRTKAPDPAADPYPVPPEHHPAHPLLAEAEELCLYWGGEVGAKLRDLICKARNLL